MTNGSTDRLDRIEAILAQVAESQQRTQQLVESNARSIAAWESRFTEIQEETEEATSSTRADLHQDIEGVRAEVEGFRADVNQRFAELTRLIQGAIDEIQRIWGRLSA